MEDGPGMVQIAHRLIEFGLRLTVRLRWIAPTVARLFVGYLFAHSGWDKVHRLAWFTANFQHWGIIYPAFMARLTAFTELIFGSMLLIGLLTRPATIPLLVDMGVALATVQIKKVSNFYGFVSLHEPYYMVVFVYLMLDGAGPISLDYAIERFLHLPGWSQTPVEGSAPRPGAGHQVRPRPPGA